MFLLMEAHQWPHSSPETAETNVYSRNNSADLPGSDHGVDTLHPPPPPPHKHTHTVAPPTTLPLPHSFSLFLTLEAIHPPPPSCWNNKPGEVSFICRTDVYTALSLSLVTLMSLSRPRPHCPSLLFIDCCFSCFFSALGGMVLYGG